MTAIDRVLFPFALVLIYYIIALWCLHQPSTSPTESFASPAIEKQEISSTKSELKVLPMTGCPINKEWLETQSHKNLKAIASEFSIKVADKRSKLNYINAILDTLNKIDEIDTNLLSINNFCFAVGW